MSDKIYFRRGNAADLPSLASGEPGFAVDTKRLYVGSPTGNVAIPRPAQDSYTAPTLLNAWVNNGVYETAGYYKDDFGMVHIRGLVKSGTLSQIIFTLPTGYRPASPLMRLVLTNNGTSDVIGRIEISTGGSISIFGGGNTYVSLGDINPFRGEL